jgi:predicted RNA binding protein YcfA (HicA-like mRNA interferase family)
MVKTPRLTATDLIRILKRFGFVEVRSKGSHHFYRHPDGRCTVVPVHRGEIIGQGLLRAILRDTELTNDDLLGS